jgi:hypothetical protein
MAIESRLHPNNFSRDPDLTLSRLWHTVTNMIQEHADVAIQRKAKARQTLDCARKPQLARVKLEHEPQHAYRWDVVETVTSQFSCWRQREIILETLENFSDLT